jgi:uncharacterized cupin superfamily protein
MKASKNFKRIEELFGTFSGSGVNHEGQNFTGVLTLKPGVAGKSIALEFTATGTDGTVYHAEQSNIGYNVQENLSLWVASSNHPAMMEHTLKEILSTESGSETFLFQCGDFKNNQTFREEIALKIWSNQELSYTYSWGLPGEEYKERSGARMISLSRVAIPEAKLVQSPEGITPQGDGWYILNAKDARWSKNEKFGQSCGFEGDKRFSQYGFNIHIIKPDQPSCHYHGEDDQEDFLVLKGQCKLIIEGQERLLKEWDFLHCPKWARHVFVGTGTEPCVIVMTGGRAGHGVTYPVNDLVKKYDACPPTETNSPKESYSDAPKWTQRKNQWL